MPRPSRNPTTCSSPADGKLWILDQVDPNKVFTVDPADGKILNSFVTECIHGSGITIGDGALWLTSTKAVSGPPVTMKVDIKTGATIKKWETPGWGVYGVYASNAAEIQSRSKLPLASGGHGIKWTGNGQYWMAVPASGKLYLMNAEDGTVARTIQAPTVRTHGIALDGDYLWCVGSDEMENLQAAEIRRQDRRQDQAGKGHRSLAARPRHEGWRLVVLRRQQGLDLQPHLIAPILSIETPASTACA